MGLLNNASAILTSVAISAAPAPGTESETEQQTSTTSVATQPENPNMPSVERGDIFADLGAGAPSFGVGGIESGLANDLNQDIQKAVASLQEALAESEDSFSSNFNVVAGSDNKLEVTITSVVDGVEQQENLVLSISQAATLLQDLRERQAINSDPEKISEAIIKKINNDARQEKERLASSDQGLTEGVEKYIDDQAQAQRERVETLKNDNPAVLERAHRIDTVRHLMNSLRNPESLDTPVEAATSREPEARPEDSTPASPVGLRRRESAKTDETSPEIEAARKELEALRGERQTYRDPSNPDPASRLSRRGRDQSQDPSAESGIQTLTIAGEIAGIERTFNRSAVNGFDLDVISAYQNHPETPVSVTLKPGAGGRETYVISMNGELRSEVASIGQSDRELVARIKDKVLEAVDGRKVGSDFEGVRDRVSGLSVAQQREEMIRAYIENERTLDTLAQMRQVERGRIGPGQVQERAYAAGSRDQTRISNLDASLERDHDRIKNELGRDHIRVQEKTAKVRAELMTEFGSRNVGELVTDWLRDIDLSTSQGQEFRRIIEDFTKAGNGPDTVVAAIMEGQSSPVYIPGLEAHLLYSGGPNLSARTDSRILTTAVNEQLRPRTPEQMVEYIERQSEQAHAREQDIQRNRETLIAKGHSEHEVDGMIREIDSYYDNLGGHMTDGGDLFGKIEGIETGHKASGAIEPYERTNLKVAEALLKYLRAREGGLEGAGGVIIDTTQGEAEKWLEREIKDIFKNL